jgi:hypothetical protein
VSLDHTRVSPDTSIGFHEGERAVQVRAGVAAEAARLTGMLALPNLDGGARLFLAHQEFAALTARDASGLLWTSPLFARRGFLDAHGQTLHVDALPATTDPLSALPAGQAVGMVAINFARRRRMRVNGTIVAVDGDGFSVEVNQAYGNCPQFIQRRHLDLSDSGSQAEPTAFIKRSSAITEQQRLLIGRVDTFFLGTTHPTRGNDASHRGGLPGFVRSTAHELWWPDYPGNNMFNSLGNLAVDATASILFIDFTTGETLQLSGSATVDWNGSGTPGNDGRTGRRIRFAITDVIHISGAFQVRFEHGAV